MLAIIGSIAAFFGGLAILIIVHEFGHFWVARRFGVKVLRFSIGFGRPVWRYRDRKGTEFVVSLFPVGGYIKMCDERDGVVAQHDLPFAFNRQSLGKRIAIVSAGPLFNVLFAFLINWLVLSVGVTTLAPIIGEVHPDSIASRSGFHKGDEFISINGRSTQSWQRVGLALLAESGRDQSITATVHSDSQIKFLTLQGHFEKLKETNFFDSLGLEPYLPPIPPIVGKVLPNSPAVEAGLRLDDRILAVAGKPITDWGDFVGYVKLHPNQGVNLRIERDNAPVVLYLHIASKKASSGERMGYIGLASKRFEWPTNLLRNERYSPFIAWLPAAQETWTITTLTAKMLTKLFIGQLSLRSISGPVGIAQGAGESASAGWEAYLSYLALISISLGILNILPIPALDGGYILYYLIEFVLRRPIPDHMQEIGFRIGICLLLTLMIIAFYNDITRLLM